jgi:hypothetical protein
MDRFNFHQQQLVSMLNKKGVGDFANDPQKKIEGPISFEPEEVMVMASFIEAYTHIPYDTCRIEFEVRGIDDDRKQIGAVIHFSDFYVKTNSLDLRELTEDILYKLFQKVVKERTFYLLWQVVRELAEEFKLTSPQIHALVEKVEKRLTL